MRQTITLFLFLSSAFIFAQEKNSLLWEISGNGLKESSYLYGTMHVSKKIAFRLDDVFYEALDKSDVVALESDPSTWLGNDQEMGMSNFRYGNSRNAKGFYTRTFAVRNPRKEDIGAYLAFEDRLINNILYRTNEFSQNFEEDTYLDMFIYQAGKKFQKPIVALEDLEESSALVGRASLNAMKKKPDEWLQKKMQQQDPMVILQDAYRERNIALLDSIDQAMYTKHYLKNMLYIRNENMAHKLDSVMQNAKVFTGIGAAHLPGENGVIALLRDRGYTVKALVSKATSKGRQLKEKFESKIRENTYATESPDDGFFSITLPNKLYPVSEYINTTYISPDLANGSYMMVNRIPTYAFLKQDYTYSIDDIDQLLFENIPGTILEKTRIERNGFKGIDIKNKLKNGDHQRYHIYLTPLEILIFKMGGEGTFVAQRSDTIFNSIAFKLPKQKKVLITSGFKDFEVEMPSFYTFLNRFRNGNRAIEGYDSISKSYYFLRKATLNDLTFIEEDTFELKQIQKRFYQDLELNPVYETVKNRTLISHALIDSATQQKLHLKTTFRAGEYYLMGVKTAHEEEASTFFNSFQLKAPSYEEVFKTVKDTALYFTTSTTIKPPKFVENSNQNYSNRKKPKPYAAYNKKTIYRNKNNDQVTVILNKSHDYLMFPNIDSVWALRKKIYARKRFNITREAARVTPKGHYELQLTLTDTASTRGVLIKNILKGGMLYEVKALVDTVQKPNRFVTEFFEHFKPMDTVLGKGVLIDKTADFFAALRANDSIVLSGHRFLKFEKKHIDSLKYYISEFDFKDDKKHIQAYLIQRLGRLNDPDVTAFFNRFYAKSYNNSNAQTKILQAVTKNSDEASAKLLLALMARDLPLTSSTFEMNTVFRPFLDSLPLAKKLYPEILDYSAIEEYKSPIFSMLAGLKSKGLIKPNSYKKYRKQILNDAKIQLKRQLGKTNTSRIKRRSFNSIQGQKEKVLEDYVILLYPFIKEKGVRQFFNRLRLMKDPQIRTTYVALLAKDDMLLPNGLIDSLAADMNSRNLLFSKLKEIDKLDLFPSKYKSRKALAEANVFKFKSFDKEKDSIVFVTEKELNYRGKNYVGYYFKTRNKQEYDKNFKMHLVVYKKDKELIAKPFYVNNGMRIEDTNTDKEVIDFVTEGFMLKDRRRAIIYKPNLYNGYEYYNY